MCKEKLALVIDGNWLMMSRFFLKRDCFDSSLDDKILEKGSEQLADLMSQSICIVLRQFRDCITNIIFVSDNRSWRKELPIPACVTRDSATDEYKGTRVRDDKVVWSYVYKSINLLEERFRDLGFTTVNSYGVEGDDWCWWWSRKLNSEGTNVLLWTSDEDVKQLIQQDPETGAFTAWFEKSKGVVLNSSMKKQEVDDGDELSFFMTPLKVENNLVNEISKLVKVTYINPSTIINKKIYVGDGGDNILPVFTYHKGSKTYKATQKDWEKIVDFNKDSYRDEMWNETTLNEKYNNIYKNKQKVLGSDVTNIDDFIEHINYNRRMVWLDESQIPENIQNQMSTVEYKEVSEEVMHDLKYNYKLLSNSTNNSLKVLMEDVSF